MISREKFQEWKQHPVTGILLDAIKERIGEVKEILTFSDDPDYDRKLKGMVHGFTEVLEWQPEVIDAEVQREDVGAQSSD